MAISGTFVMQPDYEATETGFKVHFINFNPGPGQSTDYYVYVTSAEMLNINQNQLQTLLRNKLVDAFGTGNVALNTFAGSSIVL